MRSSTNCRTAVVAPTAVDSIHEAHHYEYDRNIIIAGTVRVKPDMTMQPDTVQRARDERCEPPPPLWEEAAEKVQANN